MEKFYIGERIAQVFRFPHITRIACVVGKQNYDGFSVIVAKNRGAELKAFHEEDIAIEWLFE